METLVLSIVAILWVLGARFNAVMDCLQFRYDVSKFSNKKKQTFWNPSLSWVNKYKDGDTTKGPKWFGLSTTVLVGLTDAWHLFQLLSNTMLALSVIVVMHIDISIVWWQILLRLIGLKMIWGSVFELHYEHLFIKKT